MNISNHPGKWYKRFRQRHRFDKTLLIFAIDTFLNLTKLCIAVALLATAWVATKAHTHNTPTAQSKTNLLVGVKAEVATKNIVNTKATIPQKPDTPPLIPTDTESVMVAVQSVTRATAHPPINRETDSISKKPTGNDNSSSSNKLLDESWILRLDPSSHIIQFGASTDLLALEEFIPAIKTGDPIAIYPYAQTLSGKPVYGIATGVYESNEAASAAAAYISAQAKSYQPWVRQVADLTIEINNTRSKQLAN